MRLLTHATRQPRARDKTPVHESNSLDFWSLVETDEESACGTGAAEFGSEVEWFPEDA